MKLKQLKKPVLPKKTAHPKSLAGTAAPKTTAATATPKGPEPKISPEQALNAKALGSLIDSATELEGEGRQFMEPAATAVKKKRGRPSNAEKAERETQTPPPAATPPGAPPFDCKPACRTIFGITSAWIVRYTEQPAMALLPGEVDGLGDAWGAVCNRYIPDFLAEHGEIVAAVAITGAVSMRLYSVADSLIAEKHRERNREAERARATGDAGIRKAPDIVMTEVRA